MTKLTAYKCDKCGDWTEEKDISDAQIILKGKSQGRYRLDMCPPCVTKLDLGEAEQVPTPTPTHLPPTRPRHRHTTPEERVALVKRGRKLLDNGATPEEVAKNLEIAVSTWNRWQTEFVSASLSASEADPDRATRAALGV